MSDFISELKHIKNDNKMNEGANTSLYDYIASNYYKLSKEELKELILNLDYAIYNRFGKNLYLSLENQALEDTIERLSD